MTGAGSAGLAGLAGCTSNLPFTGGQQEFDVSLGVLVPESGGLASLTIPIRDAGLLATKQVQNSDELENVTVTTQVEDTETSAETAVERAQLLANSGVTSVFGPATSGASLAVTEEVAAPREIVACSCSATSPDLTAVSDNGYFFRTAPSDALQARVLAQLAAQSEDIETAAVMHLQNDYGSALASAFSDSFAGETVATVPFPEGADNYEQQLGEALNAEPDSMVIIGYPASGVQIFSDFYDFYDQPDLPVFITDGLVSEDLPGQVGNPMTNVSGTSPLASGPGFSDFESAFVDEYADYDSATVFTSNGYDAVAVLLLANVAAAVELGDSEAVTGSEVQAQMRNVANPGGTEVSPANLPKGVQALLDGDEVQYVGASSQVDFDDNGDMTAVTYEVFQYTEDGLEQTDTVDFGQ